jgi:hypothetical protein
VDDEVVEWNPESGGGKLLRFRFFPVAARQFLFRPASSESLPSLCRGSGCARFQPLPLLVLDCRFFCMRACVFFQRGQSAQSGFQVYFFQLLAPASMVMYNHAITISMVELL